MEADALDRKLTQVFAGKVVRKDLLHQIKGGENVPSYVLEYLLGKYCASDDPLEIELGIEAVKDTLHRHYFRHDESNKAQSLVEQRGRHRFIDRVQVRYLPSETKHWAAMDNFGYNRIHVPQEFYRRYDRLLEGGIWAMVDLEFVLPEEGRRDSPFHIADLRPIQLARFDLAEFCEGRRQFTREDEPLQRPGRFSGGGICLNGISGSSRPHEVNAITLKTRSKLERSVRESAATRATPDGVSDGCSA